MLKAGESIPPVKTSGSSSLVDFPEPEVEVGAGES